MRCSWHCEHPVRLVIAVLAAAALLGCEVPTPAIHPDAPPAPAAHVEVQVLPHACRPAGFPTRWDAAVAAAERRYLPASWRRVAPCGWRAQLAAESGLDDAWCHRPNPQGTTASCIGQLTDAAAADVARQAGIVGAQANPQASIRAGAFYLASLRRVWSEPRSVACRRTLAVASYHGGAGTIVEGQRLARARGRTARCYAGGIGEHLPRHRAGNNAYVARVAELQRAMGR